MFDVAELPEPVIHEITEHQRWSDFKALLMHWADRERRERGLPPLEVEIAAENAMIAAIKP